MAVHKDCYAPIGLIQQGGPHRRKTDSTAGLCGDLQGIAGRAMPEIESLDILRIEGVKASEEA